MICRGPEMSALALSVSSKRMPYRIFLGIDDHQGDIWLNPP